MMVFGQEYSFREYILLLLVIILTIGFFLSVNAGQRDIREYREAYNNISLAYYNCVNGFVTTSFVPLNFSLNEYPPDINK